MFVHLCETHRLAWEAMDPEMIQAKIRTQRALPQHRKMHCGDCSVLLTYPLFRLCAPCAERERLCQQCCSSTLMPEEKAEAELRERQSGMDDEIIDNYWLVVKTYGFRSDIAKRFRDMFPEVDLSSMLPSALDQHILDRPIWKEALGPDVYKRIFCDNCAEEYVEHGFREAVECEHLAIGRAYVLCHLCAAREGCCAGCGESVR